jgi:tetratricopeptide (TPR) repeat protein
MQLHENPEFPFSWQKVMLDGEEGDPSLNDRNADAREETLEYPGSPSSFIQLAEAQFLRGRYEEAIHICEEGLKKAPQALRGRMVLGKCYFEKGMVAEAKQEWEKVAEEIEECLPVFKLLSRIYLQEKNVDPLLDDAPEGEKVRKGLIPPETNLREEKAKQQTIPGKPDTREDLPAPGRNLRDGDTPKVMQTDTLAEIYLKQGHMKKALSISQEILAREPGNSEVQGKYEMLKKRLGVQQKAAGHRKVIQKLERWLTAVVSQGDSPLP